MRSFLNKLRYKLHKLIDKILPNDYVDVDLPSDK